MFSVAALLLALFVLRTVLPIYGTIWILVMVYVVARLSYGTRMTNAALIQIHKELEESAQICGAATAGVQRRVLVPLLAPSLLYAWTEFQPHRLSMDGARRSLRRRQPSRRRRVR